MAIVDSSCRPTPTPEAPLTGRAGAMAPAPEARRPQSWLWGGRGLCCAAAQSPTPPALCPLQWGSSGFCQGPTAARVGEVLGSRLPDGSSEQHWGEESATLWYRQPGAPQR